VLMNRLGKRRFQVKKKNWRKKSKTKVEVAKSKILNGKDKM